MAHPQPTRTSLTVAVLTVSDTRTAADDRSGARIATLLEESGHTVGVRAWVHDEIEAIRVQVATQVVGHDALVVTGGTGLAPRDVTPEAIEPLFEKSIPGFGSLFRQLSYAEIGTAAMVSRACAGIIARVPTFVLPGSVGAVDLAMTQLILPELAHVHALLHSSVSK